MTPVSTEANSPRPENDSATTRRGIVRSAWILGVGGVASYGLAFARNLILARVLTKADFGLAALLGTTLLLVDVASRMSFGQQIVQSPHGASKSFRDTSHAFQSLLALGGASLVLVLGRVMAQAVDAREQGWAFEALAVVLMARGLESLDYYRQQRALNPLPGVLCDVVPQLVVTLAAWPLAVWLGDFRAVFWIIIGKSLLSLAMTHWVATERYSWEWRPEFVRAMLTFGSPLLLNGLLMFCSQQADQVLVAAVLSTEALASYTLAFSLVSVPWAIFTQPALSFMLPVLSRAQDDPECFRRYYRACVELTAVGAVVLTLPMIGFGEQIVTMLYGEKYARTGVLMALMGSATAVRFLRFTPSVAAMAKADTRNQLISNLWRSMSLPLAVLVAVSGGGAALIAACALVAEICAGLVAFVRLARLDGSPLRDIAAPAAYTIGFVTLADLLVTLGSPAWSLATAVACSFVGAGVAIAVGWLVFPASFRVGAQVAVRGVHVGIGREVLRWRSTREAV